MHNIDLRYRSCLGGRAHGSDRGVKRHGGSATSLGHLRESLFEPIHDHGHGEGTGDPPTRERSTSRLQVRPAGVQGHAGSGGSRRGRGRQESSVYSIVYSRDGRGVRGRESPYASIGREGIEPSTYGLRVPSTPFHAFANRWIVQRRRGFPAPGTCQRVQRFSALFKRLCPGRAQVP